MKLIARMLGCVPALLLSTSAFAQNAIEIEFEGPSFGELMADIESAEELSDWIMWATALDGPFSGGPGDHTQHDLDLLDQCLVGEQLLLSSDLFWLVDHQVVDVQIPIVLQQHASGQITQNQAEQALSGLLTDLVVQHQIPIDNIVVDVSNGF